jgi:ribosomal protein L11 methyltransferase
MNYIKIIFCINPNEEWYRDVLSAQLGEIGFESFMETELGLEAYIPETDFNENSLKDIVQKNLSNNIIKWDKAIIEEKNWNEEWEKNYFKPLLIGNECVIRAPFHKEFPNAKFEVIIEPNMAFGTGNHETTSMMIEAILNENITGKVVLDMGCGTGILGILASMKGAEKITAIDISEWAVSGTRENAHTNGIKNITALLGDAGILGSAKYNLIFANIQRNVIVNDMKIYAENLIKGGKLFVSGFYIEDLEVVKKEAERQKLNFVGYQERNNWIAAIFQS